MYSTTAIASSLRRAVVLIPYAIAALMVASAVLFTPVEAREHRLADGLTEAAPPPKPIAYDKLTSEAVDLLSQELRINTTNPPGNELPLAKLLKEKFLSDGIPATVWEPRPGRGIVAARLLGSGRHNQALVLLSHLDVVSANPKEWQAPPFAGQVKDGAIWGRGAIDDKGPGAIELMAMLAIKRAGLLLDRDVIFIATGDEEEGGRDGAGWMVDHEADVFADAGYLLNEGGGIMALSNGRRYYGVSLTEKTPLWLRLTAQGVEGHAAAPPAETAITHLVAALDRLIAYRPQIRIIDPVRDYFEAIGELEDGPPQLRNLPHALRDDPDFARKFVAVPRNNALVRDTFTPTVLSGSPRTDIIPASAAAEIDGCLLPGDDPQEVITNLRKVIADDSIRIDVILNFAAASSPRKSRLMTAIGQVAQADDARVVPEMTPGFTDSHYFRQKGLIAYGFIPLELTPAEEKGFHGSNEHLTVRALGAGIKRMVALLKAMGGL
jgi:acetylornithine deacetylase/succinyl-diaminopimelate desuccinylase-like protein